MKIFSKISDFLFKVLEIVLVLLFVTILVFIVKWRINALYINSLSTSKIDYTIVDEFEKTKADIINFKNGNVEEQLSTPQPLLEEDINENLVCISIPEGSNIEDIGSILLENNLMTNMNAFVSLVDSMGLTNKFQAGSFKIEKENKIKDTVLQLTNSKYKSYEIDISEGAAADAVAKKLQELGIIESAYTFEQNCKEYGVYYSFKPGHYKIETPIKIKVLIGQLTQTNI